MKKLASFLLFGVLTMPFLNAQTPTKSDSNNVEPLICPVEIQPYFPGCESITDKSEKRKCAETKMLEFIYCNIKYPQLALQKKNPRNSLCSVYSRKKWKAYEL
jgi:hypothetical protein